MEERSRTCRAGLRPPIPLSPEEEIRGRFGLRISHRLRFGAGVSECVLRRRASRDVALSTSTEGCRTCPSVAWSACDVGLVEVLEFVANDLSVAHGVDEPASLHGRDLARFFQPVDQAIERADSALPEVLELAPLFGDVEALGVPEILRRCLVCGAPTDVPVEYRVDSA